MFYIKLDDEMNLVITVRDTLRRGDNLSHKVIYLIPNTIKDGEIDPLTAAFYLSYLRADGIADIVELERLQDMYNESYYQFTFPVTCKLTRFPGEVVTWMQIYDGDPAEPTVVKSGECILQVQESKNTDDYLYTDQVVTALYQYKKRTDEQIGEANENIEHNTEAIAQNSEDISNLYQLVAERANGLTFDETTGTLQLTADGVPVGNPVIISAVAGKAISSVSLTTDGELMIFFTDGTYTNVGRVVGEDGKVYVPHVDEHKVLTFTIEDKPGEIPDPTDLNPDDEWQPMDGGSGKSDYVWEGI